MRACQHQKVIEKVGKIRDKYYLSATASQNCLPTIVTKGLFPWKEEDLSTRKIRESGKTFRLFYMQKFRPKWLPSGEGKEE